MIRNLKFKFTSKRQFHVVKEKRRGYGGEDGGR